jgi:hypothetical protein
MVVIAQRAWQQYLDLAALRCLDQTVREYVIGLRVRPQQELSLRTAASHHVELARKDLSGQRHPVPAIKNSAKLPPM